MRRFRFFWLMIVALAVTALCLAQDSSSQGQQTQPQNPPQDQQQQNPQNPPSDQGKKDKKKKDKKDKGQDLVNADVFSDAVANNVLNDVRDGLEGHTQRLMLSAFDQDKMSGYLSFEDQIEAFFQKYSEFRIYFRIVQSSVEGSKGLVLVDCQLEETPRSGTPVRRNSQLRFEMERGKKGWKIVDFNPRGFFS